MHISCLVSCACPSTRALPPCLLITESLPHSDNHKTCYLKGLPADPASLPLNQLSGHSSLPPGACPIRSSLWVLIHSVAEESP